MYCEKKKLCLGKCGQLLSLKKFGKCAGGKFGRRPRCNRCRAAEARDHRKANPLSDEQRILQNKANRVSGEKFRQTAKGKAAQRRSNQGAKKSGYSQRWRESEKGKQSLSAASKRLTSKKRAWVQAEKVKRGCIDCGYSKHAAALDFDHVHGDKLFEVSKAMGRSLDVIKAEIAKCVVRCSNCHRIRTFEARQISEDKRRIK